MKALILALMTTAVCLAGFTACETTPPTVIVIEPTPTPTPTPTPRPRPRPTPTPETAESFRAVEPPETYSR